MLIAKGIDVNLQDQSGQTALQSSLNQNTSPSDQHKQVAEQLMKTTDLHLSDKKGYA